MNNDVIGKSIERGLRIGKQAQRDYEFCASSIFCGRILSAEEAEKVVMFLVIERKGISLGNGLQSTSPWLPSALLFYFFLY
jgi:hypothetical protein